ncbi:hypothetical protein Drorol1_Dr00026085 [Drosera rotundifolia]
MESLTSTTPIPPPRGIETLERCWREPRICDGWERRRKCPAVMGAAAAVGGGVRRRGRIVVEKAGFRSDLRDGQREFDVVQSMILAIHDKPIAQLIIRPINSSEEANDHDQQQNATEQEQAENDNNVNETELSAEPEPKAEADYTDTRITTADSHTTTQQISLLVKIDTTSVDDDEENDGFRTPTSSDHKIPEIRSCPPAPRKTMLHRRPAFRTRRKIMSWSTRRVLLDVSKEVDSLFPDIIRANFELEIMVYSFRRAFQA